MMIKGNDPEKILFGSTLATNDFAGTRFDFMLTNPPYGKSWKSDQKSIVDGKEVIDHRFEVTLTNFRGEHPKKEPAIPRSSDGQLLFLMEMVDKMKRPSDSPLGSVLIECPRYERTLGGYDQLCRMHAMRRFIVLIIMLIVPLQFAWAAAAGLHGHVGKDVATAGFHTHDLDHHESAHPDHDTSGDTNNQDHNEDGHHGHYHPVFSTILMESGITLDMALPDGPILYPPAAFFSRIPPLLDRPPLARA